MQARQAGTQLQNATATVNGQEGILEAWQQNKKLQRKVTDFDLFGKTLVRGGQRNSGLNDALTDSESNEVARGARALRETSVCLTQGSESVNCDTLKCA